MFLKSYLDNAALIISQYKGEEPLPSFLKKFFSGQKKFGSRDRKQISHLCYCFYRLGGALPNLEIQERLLVGLFLCSHTSQPVLAALKPSWEAAVQLPLEEKIALVQQELAFDPHHIFPFADQLSPQINADAFAQSFLVQPYTYLRLRPGKKHKVLAQLEDIGVAYQLLPGDCVAVPPGAKLDEWLMLDRDAVVQDRSSQQVLSLLEQVIAANKKSFSSWDCCAASGGKSLLLHDLFPSARLTVSDIRTSILANLRKRFENAGITEYKWFVGDLSAPDFQHPQTYDLVLCDAPCSGSGTWSRTPEGLYFFQKDKIHYYTRLQQSIAAKAARNVAPGGYFLYITCSVFSGENEAVVQHLQEHAGLQLQQMQYFKGYHQKADTLFAAIFNRL